MTDATPAAPRQPAAPPGTGRRYAEAATAVAVATLVAWALAPFVAPPNLAMVYLLAVVAVAARHGRGPSVFTSIASVAAFDFFFVPPFLTLAVGDTESLLTFAVMLVVGIVIGGLTVRVRRQAEAAARREQQTVALYAMSRELAQTASVSELVRAAARHIAGVFEAEVAVLLADASGQLRPGDRAGGFAVAENDLALGRWVLEHGEPAGLGTETSAGADAIYLPLRGPRGPLGVVGLRPRGRRALARDARRHVETFVEQTALVLERARLAEEAQEARVGAESERIRNSLLTSISHDLRTPLAAITGAATTMLESGTRLPHETRRELLESVRAEAERLNRLVQNLLEMTRLESGALPLRRDWHPLEEVVGAALARLTHALGSRRVAVTVPRDLPLVAIDDVLVEQVLVNLLDNATRYTPPSAPIRILVTANDRDVVVEVADAGPGLRPGDEERVFEKFYRAAPDTGRGAGLGLAICRAIVAAHGGRIQAQNLPEGGVAFLFTLPLKDGSPRPVPADA
ncbi:MAG: DUF4118 domain-containing protein [Candidatus Rokuibacteriota bacterium]